MSRREWKSWFGAGRRERRAVASEVTKVRTSWEAFEVDGVDISPSMIAQAKQYNRHGERVRYHESAAARLPFPDATFDFVFTKIVLQHVAVDLQRTYVREFLRVAKDGALVVFQAVARALSGQGGHAESPVETPDGTYTIDMNVFPRHDVEATLAAAGGRLVHSFTDESAGNAYESRFYAAVRQPRRGR